MSFGFLDASQIMITYGGVDMEGFSRQEGWSFDFNEVFWDDVPVLGGASIPRKKYNKTGTYLLKLLPTSPTNQILTGFYLADEATGRGALPFIQRDLLNGDLIISAAARIQKPPKMDQGPRLWKFTLYRGVANYGNQ